MANININVGEFQCEQPVITKLEYKIGSEKEFIISFTSLGSYYQTNIDPGTTIEMYYSVDGGAAVLYTATTLQFNETDLVVDYTPEFSTATTSLTVELFLTTIYCSTRTNLTIPNGI